MEYLIRTATEEDMPDVLRLIRELAEFEKEPDAVEMTVEVLVESGFGSQPLFTCFVAEYDAKVVGMALVYYRFSTWKGKALYLEDLVVQEDMRGKGIGKALFEKVMTYANNQNAKRVNWVVLDWNTDAVEFYRKSGATIMPEWWQVCMDQEALRRYKG